jgi:pimeloyl-ACP methyl ester carboxylesterase
LDGLQVEHPDFTRVGDLRIEWSSRGAGAPVLFLHAENGPDMAAPVLDLMARSARVMAPAHPGYGRSELDRAMTGVDDLALFYLDLLRQFDLTDVTLVGVGIGGWIAAEMAVHDTARVARLVLGNPVGIKVGDRETRDIVDMFSLTDKVYAEHAWADPALGLPDTTQLPDDVLTAMARARESTARFGWSPYLHDPKLKRRLRRVDVPTLVVWGAADRLVGVEYGRAYAAAIPGARFEVIEGAGHFPHLEKPAEFAGLVGSFI